MAFFSVAIPLVLSIRLRLHIPCDSIASFTAMSSSQPQPQSAEGEPPQGSITPDQAAWLERTAKACHVDWADADSKSMRSRLALHLLLQQVKVMSAYSSNRVSLIGPRNRLQKFKNVPPCFSLLLLPTSAGSQARRSSVMKTWTRS